MSQDATTCNFGPCKCQVQASELVRRGEKLYCSERCADERGCDHHHCNCGDFPEEEPLTPI